MSTSLPFRSNTNEFDIDSVVDVDVGARGFIRVVRSAARTDDDDDVDDGVEVIAEGVCSAAGVLVIRCEVVPPPPAPKRCRISRIVA